MSFAAAFTLPAPCRWFLSCHQSLNPAKQALRCSGGRPGDVQAVVTAGLFTYQSQESRALSAGAHHGLASVGGALVRAPAQAAGPPNSSPTLGRPPGPDVGSLLKRNFTAATETHTLNNISRKLVHLCVRAGGTERVWVCVGLSGARRPLGPAWTPPFSSAQGRPWCWLCPRRQGGRHALRARDSGSAPSCCCSHSPRGRRESQGRCGSLPCCPQGGGLGLTVSKLLVLSRLWFLLLKDLVENVKRF